VESVTWDTSHEEMKKFYAYLEVQFLFMRMLQVLRLARGICAKLYVIGNEERVSGKQ
jgi:hypothetical protein